MIILRKNFWSLVRSQQPKIIMCNDISLFDPIQLLWSIMLTTPHHCVFYVMNVEHWETSALRNWFLVPPECFVTVLSHTSTKAHTHPNKTHSYCSVTKCISSIRYAIAAGYILSVDCSLCTLSDTRIQRYTHSLSLSQRLLWRSTGQPEHWRQRQAYEKNWSLGAQQSYACAHSAACNYFSNAAAC